MTNAAWPIRRHALTGVMALVLLLLGFGGWSTNTRLSGAIITPGRIDVDLRRQIVQHPDGGVVREILVTEGASVAAGDIVIRLDSSELGSELAILEGQLSELAARQARLRAERDGAAKLDLPSTLSADGRETGEQIEGQQSLFLARLQALSEEKALLTHRIDQIAAQITGIEAQRAAMAEQLSLVVAEHANQALLVSRGLAPHTALLALAREEARLTGELGALTAAEAEARGRITETRIDIARLTSRRQENALAELREIAPVELQLLERRRALAARIGRLDIRAPASGTVLDLRVTTPGAVISPADPLLHIVPQDRSLIITADVAPIHIDEVHPGQPVEIVLSALPARTTPHLLGHVAVVSADALPHPDLRTPLYRVEITLEPAEAARLAPETLRPGMPVELFLQTGSRTPLAYLVQPFTAYFARAFRES